VATIFGHGLVATLISKSFNQKSNKKLLSLCVFLSVLPDFDVIGFSLGIDYGDPLGHRGFSHSILFAAMVAILLAFLTSKKFEISKTKLAILYFLCVISHAILDSLTNGGLGVGFLIPFDNTRYFSPYTPIQVSPIGRNFFSIAGLKTLGSEEIPEWVENLNEWIDNEVEKPKKYKFYTYTTEAKNSRAIACEIAQARIDNKIAAEVATFIKQSFAHTRHGDPTKKKGKLTEYVQDDLAKEVQAHINGVNYIKEYWEKRKFDKELGAKKNWTGFTCTKLARVSKTRMKKLFKKADALMKKNSSSDKASKEHIEKVLENAAKAFDKA
jgi:inner membrane protein